MNITTNLKISEQELVEIINFCKPPNCVINRLSIKNSRDKNYPYYGYFRPDTKAIRIGIGFKEFFPMVVDRTKKQLTQGYESGFYLYSREEALIYLLSHELRHIWQDQNRKVKRLGKIKGLYSESDADRYAVNKLEKWRENTRTLKLSKSLYSRLKQTLTFMVAIVSVFGVQEWLKKCAEGIQKPF